MTGAQLGFAQEALKTLKTCKTTNWNPYLEIHPQYCASPTPVLHNAGVGYLEIRGLKGGLLLCFSACGSFECKCCPGGRFRGPNSLCWCHFPSKIHRIKNFKGGGVSGFGGGGGVLRSMGGHFFRFMCFFGN